MLPLMLLAGGGGLLLSPAPLVRHRVDARTRAPLMGDDSADPVSSTWWTTFDGRNEDGTATVVAVQLRVGVGRSHEEVLRK